MSEMIERVAKAIYDAWASNRSVAAPWGEVVSLGHSIVDEARQEARAAIEAMREPTGTMLTAMRINLGGTAELHIDEAEEAWSKGIDAALGPHSQQAPGA